MAERVVALVLAGLLAATGLLLAFRGIETRAAATPPDVTLDGAGRPEWTTPQAVRVLAPGLREEGQSLFHAGLGAMVAAWMLAVLGPISFQRARSGTRVVAFLWLLPAAWALGALAREAGPSAATAAAAVEAFGLHAPVFALFLVLGLSFQARAPSATLDRTR